MIKQRTLKSVIHASGVGVHSGQEVFLTLHPAPVNTGIVFRRMDLPEPVEIPAKFEFISNTDLCTCLEKDGVQIFTVEHLLSAFAGLGIDNVYVDVSFSELPIMDGSAAPFIFLIQSAGIEVQEAPKSFIRIKKSLTVRDGDKSVRVEPYDGFRVSFEIDYNHQVIAKSRQSMVFDFSSSSFVKEISRARTFGFMADYEAIRAKNLALGASLDNTVVLDDVKVLNESGLRYPDEFVKHKILDVVGDLFLMGHNMVGAFYGYKSGHSLNGQLLCALDAEQDAYEIVTFKAEDEVPAGLAWMLQVA